MKLSLLKLTSVALAATFCISAQPVLAATRLTGPSSSETAMSKCSKDMSDQQPAYVENTGGNSNSQCNGCGKCKSSCSPQKKQCPKPCKKTCPEPCQKCNQCPAKSKCNQCSTKPKCNQCSKENSRCSSCGSPLNSRKSV